MLFNLLKSKHNQSAKHNMVTTLALCAFWGMARLGEFIRSSYEEGALTRNDVTFGKNQSGKYIRLHLRKAETAPPGEIQIIHLQAQPSVLDPVAAVPPLPVLPPFQEVRQEVGCRGGVLKSLWA